MTLFFATKIITLLKIFGKICIKFTMLTIFNVQYFHIVVQPSLTIYFIFQNCNSVPIQHLTPCSPCPQPPATIILLSVSMDLTILGTSYRRIIYLSFGDWLLSFSVMSLYPLKKKRFICLFLVVFFSGFLQLRELGLPLLVMCRFLITVAFFVEEHKLQVYRLQQLWLARSRAQAQQLYTGLVALRHE